MLTPCTKHRTSAVAYQTRPPHQQLKKKWFRHQPVQTFSKIPKYLTLTFDMWKFIKFKLWCVDWFAFEKSSVDFSSLASTLRRRRHFHCAKFIPTNWIKNVILFCLAFFFLARLLHSILLILYTFCPLRTPLYFINYELLSHYDCNYWICFGYSLSLTQSCNLRFICWFVCLFVCTSSLAHFLGPSNFRSFFLFHFCLCANLFIFVRSAAGLWKIELGWYYSK